MQIIPDLPAAEYHAHPAVSKSVLDRVAISPAHARAYLDGQRTEPTSAMAFGTALHAAVLEPEKYAATYTTFSGDRRTKQGKEDYAALLASGATIIASDDAERIAAMSDAIRKHPLFVSEGMREASVFDTDEATGLAVKARPDIWVRERGIVFDLKTTEDASPAGFARSVARYRYHVQAAHYMALTGASRFVFFAVEKIAPYAVAAYELDTDALSVGRALRDRDLAAMASALEFNTWPGYPAQITTLSLPRWAATQEVE